MRHGQVKALTRLPHGDIDGPVAGLGQPPDGGFEGHGSHGQGRAVRVMNFVVFAFGGYDSLDGQSHLKALSCSASRERLGIKRLRVLAEQKARIPLVGGGCTGEHDAFPPMRRWGGSVT